MITFKQFIIEQLGWEDNYTDLLNDISKYFPKMSEVDKKAIVEYAGTDVRKDYGFRPNGETIDDIYRQLVWVYGDNNGLIDSNGSDWNTDKAEQKAKSYIIKQWYNSSKILKKQKEVKDIISKNNQSGWDM